MYFSIHLYAKETQFLKDLETARSQLLETYYEIYESQDNEWTETVIFCVFIILGCKKEFLL